MLKDTQNQYFAVSTTVSKFEPDWEPVVWKKREVHMHKHNNIKDRTMFCMEKWPKIAL